MRAPCWSTIRRNFIIAACLASAIAHAAIGQEQIPAPPPQSNANTPMGVSAPLPALNSPASAESRQPAQTGTAAPAAGQAPAATSAPSATATAMARAATATPIVHNLVFRNAAEHMVEVLSVVPTDGRPSIELMMTVWTPGFYRVENYASDVQDLSARLPTGEPLTIEKPAANRWRIETQGEPAVVITYHLLCERGSVSRNYVGEDYAVICGGPTYMTLVGQPDRPHEVHLQMPDRWTKSATGLSVAADSFAHHYRAENYDTLVDSPIAVGNLSINSFVVAGVPHYLVDIGAPADLANWNAAQATGDLRKMVEETRNFWGILPFKQYYFLNKIGGRGGGGLEHLNSTLIHTRPPRRASSRTSLSWLQFVAHEYFHAFNVKRLRPIELGPFDYEKARRTSGLWVAEGLTNYFNSLIVVRAGLCTPHEYLDTLSRHIGSLQRSPGRLAQSLAASSLETWSGDGFGGNRGRETSISYYTKGPVVGFLLDAKIRRVTENKKSLDDAMRLAYERYSGPVGYTEQQFLDTCSEVAGVSLMEFFDKALFSTEELDYSEALDWFGLQFAPSEEDPSQLSWDLQVRPDSTDEQKLRMVMYLSPSKAPVAVTAQTAPAPNPNPNPVVLPESALLQLVDGIGGVFIYSNNAVRLAEWYEKNLGLKSTEFEQGGAFVLAFKYRRADNNAESETVWAILQSGEQRTATPPQYAINYRVSDMRRMLTHLRANGVQIEKTEEHPNGRFAWVKDADGNRVELWEKLTPQ
jgi:predicted metalloprotease with PDZ domain